mmetsp:Transcript_17288/g.67250  ORF Transcript_17288/g.67250 Transcript_17288/m.67250 type:complete len:297 (-) Transcript_17288:76-966(-)
MAAGGDERYGMLFSSEERVPQSANLGDDSSILLLDPHVHHGSVHGMQMRPAGMVVRDLVDSNIMAVEEDDMQETMTGKRKRPRGYSADDQMALSHVMDYVRQHIKDLTVLEELQQRVHSYRHRLFQESVTMQEHVAQHANEMREGDIGSPFREVPPKFTEIQRNRLRTVLEYFCPKRANSAVGDAWVDYHMFSAGAALPRASPGVLLKRTTKKDMMEFWNSIGLKLFVDNGKREFLKFNPSELDKAYEAMFQEQHSVQPQRGLVRDEEATLDHGITGNQMGHLSTAGARHSDLDVL